jgi:hypothetical protein
MSNQEKEPLFSAKNIQLLTGPLVRTTLLQFRYWVYVRPLL